MKLRRGLVAILISVFLVGMVFSAELYVADQAHTDISFTVKHMVVTKVRGKFKEFDVKLYWDPTNLSASSVEAVIQTASLDTDNEKRDNHLRSADFFDAEKFPQITFKSTKIEKADEGYVAYGKLTIRGVTRDVELPFTVSGPVQDPWGNTRLGISARTQINRMDFGVSWNKSMDAGGLIVGEDVLINIEAEFIKQKP